MRFSLASSVVVALAAQSAVASNWFNKAGAYFYNKWHDTELDRWLSDYNIPHPTPVDRKDLENLVKTNWNDKVVYPYQSWDASQLQAYLTLKGQEAKRDTEKNKDSLLDQVKEYWTETDESAHQAYGNVRDWIFDSWTDSQLKAFCDHHSIPVPQPRARDSLLQAVRENYQTAANNLKETAQYPGDWLYESWSDSDLKAWLDERGYPVPQPSKRDQLVASVRRNSRLASLNMQAVSASASSSAASSIQSLSDALLDSWSESDIKEWCDKNGINVPQGSKRNELVALVRKHSASLMGDTAASTASSYYGAATSKAGNDYAQATTGFAGATNWFKQQLGLATAGASASASSVRSAASKSAESISSAASKSGASSSASASKSAAKAAERVKEEL